MDTVAIRNAVRRVVANAGGIDPAKEMMTSGNAFDPSGLALWCVESVIGGDIFAVSNKCIGSNAYLLQYDFCVPASGDMDLAESKAYRVCSALLNLDSLEVSGVDCYIRSAKVSSSMGTHFSSFSVLITLGIRGVS